MTEFEAEAFKITAQQRNRLAKQMTIAMSILKRISIKPPRVWPDTNHKEILKHWRKDCKLAEFALKEIQNLENKP